MHVHVLPYKARTHNILLGKAFHMKQHLGYKRATALIAALLIILCAVSLLWILYPEGRNHPGQYAADIFQNGTLIMSIPLTEDNASESFLVEGENGCVNEISIRSGSIGVISADCPDQLCVRQGFIRDSRLPVVCLPNRLVIQLRPLSDTAGDNALSDAVAY